MWYVVYDHDEDDYIIVPRSNGIHIDEDYISGPYNTWQEAKQDNMAILKVYLDMPVEGMPTELFKF